MSHGNDRGLQYVLRWLKAVSNTFQALHFGGSLKKTQDELGSHCRKGNQ